MRYGVGAVTRRVVEEAAKLQVAQIVASRRQVDVGGGYTGMDQTELVTLVRELSGGKTRVVRDHGGPLTPDDRTALVSFDADRDAGFDALHLDVCNVPDDAQENLLAALLQRYGNTIPVEIGAEHGDHNRNLRLAQIALNLGIQPSAIVLNAGGFIHADRQCGILQSMSWFDIESRVIRNTYRAVPKLHNMDWVGSRQRYGHDVVINVAPELALVEIDALFHVLPLAAIQELTEYAFQSGHHARWYLSDGTRLDKAKTALRYVLEDEFVKIILNDHMSETEDLYVRRVISDAIVRL